MTETVEKDKAAEGVKEKEAEKTWVLTNQQRLVLAKYLSQRPYIETFQLIAMLNQLKEIKDK